MYYQITIYIAYKYPTLSLMILVTERKNENSVATPDGGLTIE
jgi:hypothetical protein